MHDHKLTAIRSPEAMDPVVGPNWYMKPLRIPILSFFTGAGFLDIGFKNAGFHTIWHNEFDPSFVKAFEYATSRMGFPGEECKVQNRQSIVDIGPIQIAKEAFSATGKPEIFGIIGGPPCPDFSVGGKNRGQEGDRGKLSEVYINRIDELQPTFFLFENVPGLLRTKKHRKFLIEILRKLSEQYLLDIKVLNALDFGAPQDRQRIFIIGFRKSWLRKTKRFDLLLNNNAWLLRNPLKEDYDVAMLPGTLNLNKHWFPWPEDLRYISAKRRFSWPGKNDFGAEAVLPEGIPKELMVDTYIGNTEEIASLPNGIEGFRPKSSKFGKIQEGDSSRKSFKRLHRFRYSPAAAYGNNEVHLHPTLPRRITVREALRLQTVPDEYILPSDMPLSHKFKTIGNGVPVLLAQAVANAIKIILEDSKK